MQNITHMNGFIPLVPASRTGLYDRASAADYGFSPPAAPAVLAQMASRGAALSISPTLANETIQTLIQTQELMTVPQRIQTKIEPEPPEKDGQKKKMRDRKRDTYSDSEEEEGEEETVAEPETDMPLPRAFIRTRR